MKVVTRFAPSPTGYLHVGGLRTALYNFLYARQQNGEFILRIEDTDQVRYVDGAVESLIRTLSVMGLAVDRTPYVQSERLSIYKTHVERLLEQGSAYYCFCSKERLESLRESQTLAKAQTKYDRACLHLSKEEIAAKLAANEPHVVRLFIPEGETTFTDELRGQITIQNSEIDDQVLLKTDGFPTYHLAVVVDDHDMDVTHIIRGEEWISSVPKHVILYRAFGFALPSFIHLPLILNPDKSKLSKRQGDVAVEDYLAKGYLPEALLNFIALLGFSPSGDREVYSLAELTELFSFQKLNKSGAVFDLQKLNWMNGVYLRQKTTEELAGLVQPFLTQETMALASDFFLRVLEIEKERLETLVDLATRLAEYTQAPNYPAELLIWKKADATDAATHLTSLLKLLEATDGAVFEDRTKIESVVKSYIEQGAFQNGNVLWPLRAALSGKDKSPNPFELLWIFGKEESLTRLRHALTILA